MLPSGRALGVSVEKAGGDGADRAHDGGCVDTGLRAARAHSGCLSSGALFVVRAGRGEVGDRCGQGYGRGRRPRSRCCGPSRGPRRPARGRRSYGPLGAVTAEQRCCGGRKYGAMTTLASVLDLRRLLPRGVSETFLEQPSYATVVGIFGTMLDEWRKHVRLDPERDRGPRQVGHDGSVLTAPRRAVRSACPARHSTRKPVGAAVVGNRQFAARCRK